MKWKSERNTIQKHMVVSTQVDHRREVGKIKHDTDLLNTTEAGTASNVVLDYLELIFGSLNTDWSMTKSWHKTRALSE